MVALDRLVVTTALPQIGHDLGAGLHTLEWTVNAFTLAFAVLLLPGAALGDRFGRRRLFSAGLVLFTAGSAAAALAPSAAALVAARAVQGAGGAIVTPLSLALLTAATPAHRRGAVLGAWGAIAGAGAAAGPVLGGVISDALSWHWVFWLNVPAGIALVPLARARLRETRGSRGLLALPAIARSGAFAAAGATAVLAYAGLFGTLFLLGQLLQAGLGATPVQAGLALLPMTVAMAITAPVAGVLADRAGPRRLVLAALAVATAALAGLAALSAPGAAPAALAPALALAGIGAAGLFAPLQAAQLGAVAPAHHGTASGAVVALRELGGVAGVTVAGAVVAAHATPGAAGFLHGARPALLVAAALVAAAAVPALRLPGRHAAPVTPVGRPEPEPIAVPAPSAR